MIQHENFGVFFQFSYHNKNGDCKIHLLFYIFHDEIFNLRLYRYYVLNLITLSHYFHKNFLQYKNQRLSLITNICIQQMS